VKSHRRGTGTKNRAGQLASLERDAYWLNSKGKAGGCQMLKLHTPDDIFSLRHAPSWLMLCFAAGSVNGIALLACERFVTHVTGTVTRLGLELMRTAIMLDFLLVLISFIAGATSAGLMINGRAHRRLAPLFSLPLWVAASTIAMIGLVGHMGWLGPFGGTVDEPSDFVLLCALSFAMGLQNAAVATSTGQLVRTTHLTGPATDLGVHLAELMFADGQVRQTARQHAALRAGKLTAYCAGAVAAVPLAHSLQFLGLLVPAMVIGAATLLSFVRKETRTQQPAHGF
jgi:uncharacterized membrane protein YoaK (UPF0700 family)